MKIFEIVKEEYLKSLDKEDFNPFTKCKTVEALICYNPYVREKTIKIISKIEVQKFYFNG